MSYPTGMGNATGLHFNNIAAQMHAYVNHGGAQNLQSAHGQHHQFQHSHSPAFASHGYHHGGHGTGYSPMMGPDVGDFARSFMRNLLR
jgi:hypothetical protein